MKTSLIYHDVNEPTSNSRFEKEIIGIAQENELRLAFPYLNVDYLKHIVEISTSYRLLTDVDEWLLSLSKAERCKAVEFMDRDSQYIRHVENLHAKVVIGPKSALIGSANLTRAGLAERTEMSVLIEEGEKIEELEKWFDELWGKARTISGTISNKSTLLAHIKDLPTNSQSGIKKLFPAMKNASHGLVHLSQSAMPAISKSKTAKPPAKQSPKSTKFSPAIQIHIVDAILGAYPFNSRGLSAKDQVKLLQKANDAKLPNGSNAFPGMHGGAKRGNTTKGNSVAWEESKDRTRSNRMQVQVGNRHAIKIKGDNREIRFKMAEGVSPEKMGVSQDIVDALAEHGVIPHYDVKEIG